MFQTFQTLTAPEDIVINSRFHPGPSMHLSTASFLQLSGYGTGTVCLLMSSCALPLRLASLDWRTSHWHSSPLKNIQFLSHSLHLFWSVWIQLSVVRGTYAHFYTLWNSGVNALYRPTCTLTDISHSSPSFSSLNYPISSSLSSSHPFLRSFPLLFSGVRLSIP